MARYWFGGSPGDFAVQTSGETLYLVSEAALSFYDAESGGSQITDLLDSGGNAIDGGVVIATTEGRIPRFQGPDGVTQLWADGGMGRFILMTTDAADLALDAIGPSLGEIDTDLHVTGKADVDGVVEASGFSVISETPLAAGKAGIDNSGGVLRLTSDLADSTIEIATGGDDEVVVQIDGSDAATFSSTGLNVVGGITATTSVSAADLAASDDLTVGDDATISGDLAVTGLSTLTGRTGVGTSPDANAKLAVTQTADQPALNLLNNVALGNLNQPLVRGETPTNTSLLLAARVTADSQSRFVARTDGQVSWGDGSTSRDTNLYRKAADQLATDDSFLAGVNGQIGGTTAAFGGGVGVLTLKDRGTAPTSNPSGGLVLYSESGELKVRQSDGTIGRFHIRDGAWTSWTPSLTGTTSGTWNPATSTIAARYTRVGRLVIAEGKITLSGSLSISGALSGSLRISLPVTAASRYDDDWEIGSAAFFEGSPTARWACLAFSDTTTTAIFMKASDGGIITNTLPSGNVFASGDEIRFCYTYEAAADA